MKERLLHTFIAAFYDLTYTKGRSLLTLLSVFIGTTTVVSLMQFGMLAEHQALQGFKKLGTNRIVISLMPEQYRLGDGPLYTPQEYQRLQPALLSEHIVLWSPYIATYQSILYEGHSIDGQIIGVTPDFFTILNMKAETGRLFHELDKEVKFCIVGFDFAKKIQASTGNLVLGSRIHIGRYIYQVIGILESMPNNGLFFQDLNDTLYVPLNTAVALTDALPREFAAELTSDEVVFTAAEEIKHSLKTLYPKLRVDTRSSQEIIEQIQEQSRIYTLLLGAIGSLSLLVGGIGVMNILLMSIMYRKEEIGIRKAVGATRLDILWQFLSEALILTMLGSVLGLSCSFFLAIVACHFTGWTFVWFWSPVFTGLVLGIGLGLFFGFYPAFRASRLDPILLLRSN